MRIPWIKSYQRSPGFVACLIRAFVSRLRRCHNWQLNRPEEPQVPPTRGYHGSTGIKAGRFMAPMKRRYDKNAGFAS